jgi:hypothetical protein
MFVAALAMSGGLAPRARALVYWSGESSGVFGGVQGGIGRANLDGTGVEPEFIKSGFTCGVAVGSAHVFWVSINFDAVGVANLDGSGFNPELVGTSHLPCGLAVDSENIYWANAQLPNPEAIGRASLAGSNVNQNFITGAASPRAVAVGGGYVYWANASSGKGPGTSIGRAKLDGSEVNDSFITGATNPTGVAVDSSHIYWTNQENGTIGRANLNGSSVNQSFITGADAPCGLAVDGSYIYWSDRGSSTIGRAKLDGSGVKQSFISGTPIGCGVAVDALWSSKSMIAPSPPTTTYGQPLSFTATVTPAATTGPSATPTGTASFTVTGEPSVDLPLDGSGEAVFAPAYYLNVGDTVTVRYGGNGTYGSSSGEMTPTVKPADTATDLAASANPASSATGVSYVAKVRNTSTGVVPFGSVQFVVDGEPVLGPLPLDENGEVGIEAEPGALNAGEHIVRAFYHDDTHSTPDFTDSQASLAETITNPPTTQPPASPPAAPLSSSPPVSLPFQAVLNSFHARMTIHVLLARQFSDFVTLNGPGTVVQDLFAKDGVLPATASRAASSGHGKNKRAASLLAKGSASTSAAGTAKVTLIPTVAGRRMLRARRASLRVILVTSVKDARTGKVTNLPAKVLTLNR